MATIPDRELFARETLADFDAWVAQIENEIAAVTNEDESMPTDIDFSETSVLGTAPPYLRKLYHLITVYTEGLNEVPDNDSFTFALLENRLDALSRRYDLFCRMYFPSLSTPAMPVMCGGWVVISDTLEARATMDLPPSHTQPATHNGNARDHSKIPPFTPKKVLH